MAYFGIHQTFGAIRVAIPLLTLAYGLLNMYYGLVYASIQDIVAPALRGTSMVGGVLGILPSIAPWVVLLKNAAIS